MDYPLIDVTQDDNADDALMVSNPSVTKMRNNKYLMIYKAVAMEYDLPFGGPVTHQAAISDSPQGPFVKQKQRLFYKEGEQFPAEDPFVWYHDLADKYYAIVKDFHGTFTHKGASLAFFQSDDGLNWSVAPNPLVSTINIKWVGKGLQKVKRLERPQLLFENGIPIMLYCAVIGKGHSETGTYNVHIPLKP